MCYNFEKGGYIMKTFETPFVEVKKFDVEDVLTTSSATGATTETTEEPFPDLVLSGACF